MVKVSGARVVIADYNALRRDFAIPAGVSDDAIDAILVDNFAVISERHVKAAPKGVSTLIPQTGATRDGLRPVKYGRAHLIPVDPGVLISGGTQKERRDRDPGADILFDTKGSGAVAPQPASKNDHGNGLMFVSEALREYTYQKLVEEIFKKESAGEDWGVIPTYAVLDLNFQGIYQANLYMPAAIILRRSHFRLGKFSNATGEPTYEEMTTGDELMSPTLVEKRVERVQSPEQVERILKQERALRKYGVTSTSDRYPKGTRKIWRFFEVPNIDRDDPDTHTRAIVNIQVARTMEVLDFGPYNTRKKFDIPLVLGKPQDENAYGGGRTGRTKDYWVKDIPPSSPEFVQPVPELAVDPVRWGLNPLSIGKNAFLDNMSLVYTLLGDLFHARAIDKGRILAAHCAFLVPTFRKISLDPGQHSSTRACAGSNGPDLKDLEKQALEQNENVRDLLKDAQDDEAFVPLSEDSK
jgi:hypothetical protein